MGGRSGPSVTTILGKSERARRARRQVNYGLKEKSSKVAAEVTFKTLAVTNPAVASLYATYEAAKFVYPIVKKGIETYERTGDSNKAIEKMSEETVKQTGRVIKEAAVEAVVETAYGRTKQAYGIKADKIVDKFVTSAISGAINEAVE